VNTKEDYDKELEEIKAIEENQVKTPKRRKRHERKALYKSANLPYLLFQSPGIRKNKPRTKWVNDPYEDGNQPVRR
jgi:hypothetical protein